MFKKITFVGTVFSTFRTSELRVQVLCWFVTVSTITSWVLFYYDFTGGVLIEEHNFIFPWISVFSHGQVVVFIRRLLNRCLFQIWNKLRAKVYRQVFRLNRHWFVLQETEQTSRYIFLNGIRNRGSYNIWNSEHPNTKNVQTTIDWDMVRSTCTIGVNMVIFRKNEWKYSRQ